jgi:hypothetical protein
MNARDKIKLLETEKAGEIKIDKKRSKLIFYIYRISYRFLFHPLSQFPAVLSYPLHSYSLPLNLSWATRLTQPSQTITAYVTS